MAHSTSVTFFSHAPFLYNGAKQHQKLPEKTTSIFGVVCVPTISPDRQPAGVAPELFGLIKSFFEIEVVGPLLRVPLAQCLNCFGHAQRLAPWHTRHSKRFDSLYQLKP